jgi:hypothetical protein
MSEAELHVIRARLQGGILNKARRGELQCPLPVGLVYNAAGRPILDPDKQVQDSFDCYSTHSAVAVRHVLLSRPSVKNSFCFRDV